MRVSAVLNLYNGAATVREAVDSVLGQTVEDWELIVWDDHSTDAGAEIIHSYQDARIRYFRSPQEGGLGLQRRLALGQARGEWIAFIDQDDLWSPAKLEQQLQAVAGAPEVGLVYGRTVAFSAGSPDRDFDHRHEYEPLPEGDIFLELFHNSCFIAMSSAMLRREAVEAIGGIAPEYDIIPDYYLYVAVARRYAARAVEDVVCRYRLSPGGLSTTGWRPMHQEATLLVESWADVLGPKLTRVRRRRHQTLVALEDMRSVTTIGAGLVRLLTSGSLGFLLSRPFVRTFRFLRRRVQTPYYLRAGAPPRIASAAAARQGRNKIRLSILVVNWNVRDLLRECLQSVYAQIRLPSESWELVVVDNDSRDDSVAMLRREFPQAVVVANQENLGFGKANNQGYRLCRGEAVLLLNPDTVALGGALDEMLRVLQQRPDVGILSCRLLNADRSFQRWNGGSFPNLWNVAGHFLLLNKVLPKALLPRSLYLETEPREDVELDWVSGACMLLRRAAVGSEIFDERFFMYGEDVELCLRTRRKGWKTLYTPKAEVVHHDGCSLDQQESGEMRVSKMRSLRVVFILNNPRTPILLYDTPIFCGFLMRYLLSRVGRTLRPGRGIDARTAVRKQFLAEAFRTLAGR